MVTGFRCGDHACPYRLGYLDRDRADTTRAAVDEYRLPNGELSPRHQGLPDRAADESQARCFQVAEVVRLAADEVDLGDVLFGVGAGAAEDPDDAIDYATEDYVEAAAEITRGAGVDVVFDTIGGDALTRSPLALADAGRVVSIVDIAQPQNLIEAWGKNAAYHFVFTRQNRGKLDALTTLVERGLVKPVIGATLPLARTGEAHEILENRRSYALRGKVAIDVAGGTVDLPSRID